MAIKAKDQVTIVDFTDIKAVTVYYLLQLSTLATPVKPTTVSPSGWTTTEPAFDNTSTKTLYTCVKNTFGDGSFSWGDVSVSSSNEAAKVAYNKAAAAQNTADGKNTVYRQSSQPSGGTYKSGDVWFDTANGNAIYTYSGSAWIKNKIGSAAIADNAIIDGLIASNAITTDKLAANAVTTLKMATDAIKSRNYVAKSAGMFLNLADGSIDAPNFKVDSSGKVTATDGNFRGLITATGGSFTGNVSIFGQTNTTGMLALISEGKRVYNSSIQTYDNYTYNYITKLDGTGLNIMFSGRKGTSPDYDTIKTVPDETSWNDVCKISARAEYGTGGSSFSSSKHPFVEMLLKNYAGLYIRDVNVDIAYCDYSQAYFNVPMRILESTGHIGYVMHGDNQHETDPASSNYMGHKYYCCWVASDLRLHFYVDGTDIGNVSDKRLKKNIDNINSSYLKAIGSVDLKQFNITRNLMDNNKLFLGAIAQELQDKLSENNIEDDTYSILGTTNNGPNDLDSEGKENEYLSIDYEQFLLARLAYDESKISELESRIEALENKTS